LQDEYGVSPNDVEQVLSGRDSGKSLFEENPWLAQATFDALYRYSFEQGLSRRQLTIEELFAPEGLGLVEAG
jgi:hypothetical protein